MLSPTGFAPLRPASSAATPPQADPTETQVPRWSCPCSSNWAGISPIRRSWYRASGREWRSHFRAGSTRLDKREFARADLVGDKASTVAEVLDAYVDFFALRAGWAYREAEAFVRRQVEALPWAPSPPDAAPFRRVAVGDKVWVYDLASDDLECYYPVAGDPDFERNEVTAESPLGRALLGAREGEMRETQLPDGTDWVVRVVLVTSRAADDR